MQLGAWNPSLTGESALLSARLHQVATETGTPKEYDSCVPTGCGLFSPGSLFIKEPPVVGRPWLWMGVAGQPQKTRESGQTALNDGMRQRMAGCTLRQGGRQGQRPRGRSMLAYLQNKDKAPGLEMKEQREGGQTGNGSQSAQAL